MDRTYALLDLFAGCGGFTEGLVGTKRFRPVGAVELDRDASRTYAANFGPHIANLDIAEWLKEGDLPSAHVVVGGPPCQGFSNLGNRWNRDPRNALWNRYVETIAAVRPLLFVLENVPGFLKSGQFKGLDSATKGRGLLADYSLEPWILDASLYGVAQKRRRAVVVGRLRDLPPLGPLLETSRTRPPTLRDVLPENEVTSVVTSVELPRKEGPYLSTELHLTRTFSDLSLERFRNIPPGGNRFDLPDHLKAPCWVKHTTGSGDVMGRLSWDRPSVTIRTEFYKPEKGRYLHPDEDRAITHYEAARIQGFPDKFQWFGSKTSIGRQIGNAVPVPLAASIGDHLCHALDALDIHPSRMKEDAA